MAIITDSGNQRPDQCRDETFPLIEDAQGLSPEDALEAGRVKMPRGRCAIAAHAIGPWLEVLATEFNS